jgi:hypothetical protein
LWENIRKKKQINAKCPLTYRTGGHKGAKRVLPKGGKTETATPKSLSLLTYFQQAW